MKLPTVLALPPGTSATLADFADWTNQEGHTAELNLLMVTEKHGEILEQGNAYPLLPKLKGLLAA